MAPISKWLPAHSLRGPCEHKCKRVIGNPHPELVRQRRVLTGGCLRWLPVRPPRLGHALGAIALLTVVGGGVGVVAAAAVAGGPGDREVGRRGNRDWPGAAPGGRKRCGGLKKRPHNLDLSWHRYSSDFIPSKILHGLPLKGGVYQSWVYIRM